MSDKRGSGSRTLKTRVHTAKKRSNASTRWLQRQLNDPYVARAQKDGWRSRAAYKLIEIDDKAGLLRPGMAIVDLGVAPGGWAQVAARRIGSTEENPLIVGIDLLEVEPISGVILMKKDFLDDDAPDLLMQALKGRAPDLVLSDMAANTTGHTKTDHLRTTHLFEVAADFAFSVLAPEGDFLAKVFRGGAESTILAELKKRFRSVSHIKPPASRPESPELYVLARGFKG